MEYFYRDMRRLTGLLMEGDQPAGGQWNYDAENRKPAEAGLFIPRRQGTSPDAITQDVLALVADRFADHPGSLDGFDMAVTPEGAEAEATRFLKEALPSFGDYQDAMVSGQPLLWHSFLSPYLNIGLLNPLDLCRAVEVEWTAGRAPLNAAEGFIRQIIGWRDYVRGLYDWAGPDYAEFSGGQTRIARLLLERQNPDGLPCRCNRPDAGLGLCTPYPAADGHRQLCHAGGH
jgi:deoxyribodipyrimidine photolyase-related protein